MENRNLSKATKVHFIGAGGVSMSALADFLSLEGYSVSGSDLHYDEHALEVLHRHNVKTFYGHNKSNVVGADIAVYNSAIGEDNPEYAQAKNSGIPLISRQELLSSISRSFKTVYGVAGSHGKTTATCMLAHIFAVSYSPTAHIGGFDAVFDNLLYGDKEIFITEACEYKKNFLKLNCNVAVVLNVDRDHLECYDGFDDLKTSFKKFAENAQTRVINADDVNLKQIDNAVTFGIDSNADYRAEKISGRRGYYSFIINAKGKLSRRVKLGVLGRHNIYNAVAAAATALESGMDLDCVCDGIEAFRGVLRRAEFIGRINGAAVFADYAHHPKEIQASLKSFKQLKYRKMYVLFQPHTYSRTRLLMKDFVNALQKCNNVLIYATYPARECFDTAGSGFTLKENLGDGAAYFDSEFTLLQYLAEKLRKRDLLLVLGAGDIYEKMRNIVIEINS